MREPLALLALVAWSATALAQSPQTPPSADQCDAGRTMTGTCAREDRVEAHQSLAIAWSTQQLSDAGPITLEPTDGSERRDRTQRAAPAPTVIIRGINTVTVIK
jgi:hypothetical protein